MQTIASRLIKGIMLLPATADGQEGYFAFDTGAMQTAVNRAYFPELQGDTIEIAKFTEGVKKTNAEEGMLTTLNVAGIAREQLPVLLMDLMYVEKELKTVDPEIRFLGTMGIDVIRDYTVLLDYEKQEIVLDPEVPDFAAQREAHMRLEKLPIIPVEIGGDGLRAGHGRERLPAGRALPNDAGADTCAGHAERDDDSRTESGRNAVCQPDGDAVRHHADSEESAGGGRCGLSGAVSAAVAAGFPGSAAAAGGVIRFSNSYAHSPQTSA